MMKIWTPESPGKPILPARPHVCGRCGGLRREWLKEHRRHAGLSLHRACCCTCVGALQVTLSGLTVCGGCLTVGSAYHRVVGSPSVDGTYSVPFVSQPSAEACTYRGNFFDAGPTFDVDRYSDSGCTMKVSTATYGISMVVCYNFLQRKYIISTSRITNNVVVNDTGDIFLDPNRFVAQCAGTSLGNAVSNDNEIADCGTGSFVPYWYGGTATVAA